MFLLLYCLSFISYDHFLTLVGLENVQSSAVGDVTLLQEVDATMIEMQIDAKAAASFATVEAIRLETVQNDTVSGTETEETIVTMVVAATGLVTEVLITVEAATDLGIETLTMVETAEIATTMVREEEAADATLTLTPDAVMNVTLAIGMSGTTAEPERTETILVTASAPSLTTKRPVPLPKELAYLPSVKASSSTSKTPCS